MEGIKKKNTLIIIGFMGVKTAFLNVDRTEAVRRYLQENPGDQRLLDRDGYIQEFEFEDQFGTYDVWEE